MKGGAFSRRLICLKKIINFKLIIFPPPPFPSSPQCLKPRVFEASVSGKRRDATYVDRLTLISDDANSCSHLHSPDRSHIMGICASAPVKQETREESYRDESKQSSSPSKDVTEGKAKTILAAAKRRQVVADAGLFKQDPTFVAPKFQKTSKQKNFLESALSKNFFMYDELSKESQVDMVNAMQLRKISANTVLINQGEQGDNMYVVASGTFTVHVNSSHVKDVGVSDVIGELALIYQAPRAATVMCGSQNGSVWALDRKVFRNLIAQVAAQAAGEKAEMLSKVSLLESLGPVKREALADALVPMHFNLGERIIQQGDKGDVFYIIQNGSVVCTEQEGKSGDLILQAGDYFGERALLTNEARARSVDAREATTCLALGRKEFEEILGPLNDALKHQVGLRILQTLDIFPKNMAASVRDNICEAFQERDFKRGDTIIKQGEEGSSFFVVREGQTKVSQDGQVVGAHKSGDFFGEASLLRSEPRSATVVATSEKVSLFELGKNDFDRLLGPMRKSIEKTAKERAAISELKTIKFEELKYMRMLGQGTFGLVKHMAYKSNKTGKTTFFALKCMQKQQIVDFKLARNVLYEKQMMVESDHPFVLKLYRTYQDRDSLMMLLEIVPGGELFGYLQTVGGSVPTNHARFISLCVVAVFDYIHSKGICYRDLKPENLMIAEDGYIKMVDFGFAKVVKDKTFTLCGTPEYMAPEIILRRGHGKGVDYWAVGILIYECETGITPYADYDSKWGID